jgi:glycosyltransferase involved in cell wall biosynthesis
MVTGIYPTEQNPHSGTFIKSLVDPLIVKGVEVEIIHPKPGPALFRYISTAAQVFLKTLTGKFDIVHGHYGQWCLLARMQWTTPVVASFLGSDLLGDVTLEGRVTKKGMLITRISRWLCQRVDSVTVKTEEMKKAAMGNNVNVYSDGIDFELFHPIPRSQARAALGWDQDRYYILFGNNPQRAVKNYPLARAAIESLRASGVTAELVVASGLPQSALVQCINACDAVILSSISEGSPNIVKEAMACNVPVVATDVGDVRQLIGQTQGCSVCPHDPEALAAGLEQALRCVGPTTGRTDVAHLERSVIAQRVLAVYERVIRDKATRVRGSFRKEH